MYEYDRKETVFSTDQKRWFENYSPAKSHASAIFNSAKNLISDKKKKVTYIRVKDTIFEPHVIYAYK